MARMCSINFLYAESSRSRQKQSTCGQTIVPVTRINSAAGQFQRSSILRENLVIRRSFDVGDASACNVATL